MLIKNSLRRKIQQDAQELTEADANSLSELIKFEPTERPPSLQQLAESTQHRFSIKWMKYLYAQFKNVGFVFLHS